MLVKEGGRDRHEPIYSLAIGIGRVLFGGLLQLKPIVSGIELIPRSGGAVLALTHFGYLDFALTEWVVWLHTRRRIRFLATQAAFDKPVVGWLLRSMRHISVNMQAGGDAYVNAVEALRSGELVGVFPEAGVSASFTVRKFKTGAVRMSAEAGTPIVPIVVWGGQMLKTKAHRARLRDAFRAPILVDVAEPIRVSSADDPQVATEQLRQTMQAHLNRTQASYPRTGSGQWWQPAHLGGTAPTPEVAAVAETERQRRKAAARGR
ncbi:lysophospholipid acyltransferase family protein [Lacisediminihabitans profunda]|uniref:1-acyl-sn-glycerol-3-phosphate acyltransferase n=1 Tax=Lacisediminihabitans profunda TaxID=2594790 RepID=A0A5C8UQW2_9MICO|nr:lysophospholipid acyltransferase family protein [Lacisediminihabitans profunda]TXN30915.1 1-acyl-sn-glycerol-3-phosphate acyltransferase [Lacisediminihabitans profunda]